MAATSSASPGQIGFRREGKARQVETGRETRWLHVRIAEEDMIFHAEKGTCPRLTRHFTTDDGGSYAVYNVVPNDPAPLAPSDAALSPIGSRHARKTNRFLRKINFDCHSSCVYARPAPVKFEGRFLSTKERHAVEEQNQTDHRGY